MLMLYLMASTRLEERKLVDAFGEEYRASMLLPWKWLKARIAGMR